MKKVSEVIVKIERYLAAGCLVVATSITFIAAITRRVFGHPINWSIDIALFLWAWCIFFSGDLALRDDKMVNVDVLINKLPKKGRKIHSTILYVVILAFLIALLVYGSKLVYTSRVRPFQSIPAISYSWVTLSLPIGALLMIRSVISKIILLYKKKPVEEKKEIDYLHIAKEEPL
ncbi:MAG: TRAP transporter small permease [Candidatus Hydromicrobium sp.]|nr:TRAP transporter small permease [Candidatus Hydromicrobium sp.]